VDISIEEFETALKGFIGEIEQKPPAYSAIKLQGRTAYGMARNGEEVDIEPRMIKVYNLELLEWDPPEAVVDVYCSSGTYVRSLAHDLGELLGCGANLIGLRRTKSGQFALRDAVALRKLQEAFTTGDWYKYVIPAAEALGDWPSIELTNEQVDEVRHGHRITSELEVPEGKLARAISQQGELVALMSYDDETKEWQPKKVFFS
jgi:tRNA pseudouridine55 synthase